MVLSHANVFKAKACLKHSNFLKVNVAATAPHNQVHNVSHEDAEAKQDAHPGGGPAHLGRHSTTSFLTATAIIYALGAEITAAAGTRLALH